MTDDELKAAKVELAEHLTNHRTSPEVKLLMKLALHDLEAQDEPGIADDKEPFYPKV